MRNNIKKIKVLSKDSVMKNTKDPIKITEKKEKKKKI